jgi:tRNA(Ile)-lysidine synthase
MQVNLNLPGSLKHIAVALSGGPDSWALTLLARRWCAENNAQLTAITVDHKLRAESTTEAENIALECAKRGIHHVVLTWQHGGIASRIQERARDARYGLMLDYCKANDIPALLTAHHADDQAETILLRLAKASDVGGLIGLRAETARDGVQIIRPLLNYTKQELIDYICAEGVPFITDPSNANKDYARVRLRQARDVLEAEGLSSTTLQKFANKMQAADEALNYAAQQLILQHGVWESPVVFLLPMTAIIACPPALQQRALIEIWRRVTGKSDYAPELETLQRALNTLTTKQTFGGMVMDTSDSALRFYRELEDTAPAIAVGPGSNVIWDHRFVIHNDTSETITVQALGNAPTAEMEKHCPWAAAIRPAAARATLPACDNVPVSLQDGDKSGIYARRRI